MPQEQTATVTTESGDVIDEAIGQQQLFDIPPEEPIEGIEVSVEESAEEKDPDPRGDVPAATPEPDPFEAKLSELEEKFNDKFTELSRMEQKLRAGKDEAKSLEKASKLKQSDPVAYLRQTMKEQNLTVEDIAKAILNDGELEPGKKMEMRLASVEKEASDLRRLRTEQDQQMSRQAQFNGAIDYHAQNAEKYPLASKYEPYEIASEAMRLIDASDGEVDISAVMSQIETNLQNTLRRLGYDGGAAEESAERAVEEPSETAKPDKPAKNVTLTHRQASQASSVRDIDSLSEQQREELAIRMMKGSGWA